MKIEKRDLPKGEVEFKVVIDENKFAEYHAKGLIAVQNIVEVHFLFENRLPLQFAVLL